MKHREIIVALLLSSSAVCLAQNPNAKADINGLIDHLKGEYLNAKDFDWEALRTKAFETASKAPNGDPTQAIAGVLEAINDPMVALNTRWTKAQTKQRGGIGEFGLRADPQTGLVYELFVGGAAEKEGFRLGDRIISINGQTPQIEGDTVRSVGLVVTVSLMRGDQKLERSVSVFPLKTIVAPMHAGRLGRAAYLEPARGYAYGVFERGRMANELQSALRNLENSGACGYVLDFRRVRNNLMIMLAGLGPIMTLTNQPLYKEVHPNGSSDIVRYDPSTGIASWGTEAGDPLVNRVWHPQHPEAPIVVLTGPLNDEASLPIAFAGRANMHFFGQTASFQPFDYHYVNFSDGAELRYPAGVTLDRLGHQYDAPLEMNLSVPTDWATFGSKDDAVIQVARTWLEAQPACK